MSVPEVGEFWPLEIAGVEDSILFKVKEVDLFRSVVIKDENGTIIKLPWEWVEDNYEE